MLLQLSFFGKILLISHLSSLSNYPFLFVSLSFQEFQRYIKKHMERMTEGLGWLCLHLHTLSVQKVDSSFTLLLSWNTKSLFCLFSSSKYLLQAALKELLLVICLCFVFQLKISFAGNVEEAIDMYKRGLQVIKNTNYMALDDSLLEKMRVDLAELLHVSGR